MSIDALEEVSGIFKKWFIDYWVTGGYALDIAVGRLTREHKNVDFLIRIEDSGRVRDSLEGGDYVIDYKRDRIVAKKDGQVVNITTIDDFKDRYVIPSLNVDAHVPKSLMNKKVIGGLEGHDYKRIPNELLYLFMRYSINQSDVLIIKNLPVDKEMLKSIKVVIKRR